MEANVGIQVLHETCIPSNIEEVSSRISHAPNLFFYTKPMLYDLKITTLFPCNKSQSSTPHKKLVQGEFFLTNITWVL